MIAGKPSGEVQFTVRRVAATEQKPLVRQKFPSVLADRRTVQGVVTDPQGKPVAGAAVGLENWFSDVSDRRPARTDASGHFSFRTDGLFYVDADTGSHRPIHETIVAFHKERRLHGHLPMPDYPSAQATNVAVAIPLVPTGVVTGRLLDGDKPIAGVYVSLMEVKRTGRTGNVAFQDNAKTDATGRFEFPLVEADRPFDLWLMPEGYIKRPTERRTSPIRVAAGQTLALEPVAMIPTDKSVAGVVVDPDGSPVAGATVSAELRSASRSTARSPSGPPERTDVSPSAACPTCR